MPSPPVSPPLTAPVQYLKSVGPQRAQALARLGLGTVEDLLFHLPRFHEDRRWRPPVPGERAAVDGVVLDFQVSGAGRALELGRAGLRTAHGRVEALWFRRRSYRYDVWTGLRRQLTPGARVAVFGGVQRGSRGIEIRVEDHEAGRPAGGPHMGRWTPVYDLTEGVDGRWLRGLLWDALADQAGGVEDPLPAALRERQALAPLAESLRAFHFPDSLDVRDRARRRLAFDEFFALELALAAVRGEGAAGPAARPCAPTREFLTPFRAHLGFDFTPAQKKVINEIFTDMAAPRPMRRLLLGDVGSGKTVVALSALLLAVESGAQAALMAPTEILAEQHALGLRRWLEGVPVRWGVFTSGRAAAQTRRDREALARGEIQIAVGTHALLQEGVAFHRLGLAVIDEQHRFGVAQRAALRAKGEAPHVLLMTATPIPRTLAMTLYGDLSVSVIDGLPPGRPGIVTRRSSEREAWAAVRRAVEAGRQAYVVFPLVDPSEKLDLRAAVEGWTRLKAGVFPDLAVGLLHGRMKSAEKEAVMARFAAGETQVLCATPVIEVGVDVPNATVMVVLNAERFGLAQLHQLRGRVGRGRHASECHLVSPGEEGAARLALLCRWTDGFRLAEEDLRLRGPGEVLGEAQHGLPVFKAGNLVTDGPLIEEARRAAVALLRGDPGLSHPDHRPLVALVRRRFGEKIVFGKTA